VSTERAINGQSRETDSIGYTIQKNEDKQYKNTSQYVLDSTINEF